MSRIVHCVKLDIDSEGLEIKTYPGELGEKIYQSICKQAWQMWLDHQTILINEYRLSLMDPDARLFLKTEMEKFLFGDGSEKPKEYSKV